MIIDALRLVVGANLAGSVAIAAVALLRWPARSVFGASAAYGLWGLPLIMALATLVPTPQGGPIAPIVLGVANALPTTVVLGNGSAWPAMLGAAWALGALLCTATLGTRQVRFAAALRGGSPVSVGGLSVVRAARADVGPAVVGRAIVVPIDFEARFTPAEQAAILAHETQHLTRGDVLANALVALIQCLCWFNPLVHLAARWIRFDQELACDAAVIAKRPALRRPYAEALLKTQTMAAIPPMGCAWRPRGFQALRDRIRLLKQRAPSPPRRACAVLLLAVLTLGGGYGAWATQPSHLRTITDPDWSSKPNGDDLARLYPPKAEDRGQEGIALIRCRVGQTGALSACAIVRETPRSAGFGAAALRMAPLFRMKPMSMNGRPVAGGSVDIPIKFMIAAKGAGHK
jgi:TonB family protein